MLVVKAI